MSPVNERDVARFLRKVDRVGGPPHPTRPELGRCWPWTAVKDTKGYGKFGLGRKTHLAHRVAFFMAHGRWPEPFGLHSCDRPPCANPAHIFEGTAAANTADMLAKGRCNSRPGLGERCISARFSDLTIRQARELFAAGLDRFEIAARLGMSASYTYAVVTHRARRSA